MIAPFPYFGGKSKVADPVWRAFGTVSNYVEPFFGSGAVLLARPMPINGPETINDFDGMVANFWRALQADPEAVADWARCRASLCSWGIGFSPRFCAFVVQGCWLAGPGADWAVCISGGCCIAGPATCTHFAHF